MIPKEAILKAIEGGWEETFEGQFNNDLVRGVRGRYYYIPVRSCLLDPTFWQSLRNSEKWKIYSWKLSAAKFIELVLDGKDTTQFWSDLLGNKE